MRPLVWRELKLMMGGLIACAFIVAGCEKAPVGPVNIGSSDACFYCKAPILDIAFAAEIVTKDGFVRKFDDLGCLVANYRKIGKDSIQAVYAMDFQSKTWLPAESAHFVRSDKMRTPKGSGLVAFQNASDAQDLASRYQAELHAFADFIR